jgi:hypothetical protein
MAINSSTVVEHLTYNPKINSSNSATGNERDKMVKNIQPIIINMNLNEIVLVIVKLYAQ